MIDRVKVAEALKILRELPKDVVEQAVSELEIEYKEEAARTVAQALEEERKNAPPVDRSAVTTCSGDPITEATTKIKASGQQNDYVILTDEERAKGFVRPVRCSYVHVGIRPKYPTRELTDEQKEQHEGSDYVAYEKYPEDDSIVGRFWTQKDLDSGCGGVTTMGLALGETYARDPEFYGSTFCCKCKDHFPVAEFIWDDGSKEVVGS